MVFSQQLEVQANVYFSIEPYKVEIVWVYNSLPRLWRDRLPPETKRLLATDHFRHFPHFPTMGENFHWYVESSWSTLGMLNLMQVNLLSHMTEWMMHMHAPLWRRWMSVS